VNARPDPLVILNGRAWSFGFGVTAELIVPRAHWGSADPGRWLMTAIDPDFPGRLAAGDVLVGGERFAAGAADDTPARAIRDAGAGAVIAYSFDPHFAECALRLGLPAVAVNEALGIAT
jgi:3-isopropylmalate/(R)-2-methylmalate dehydratase small subunit